MRVVSRVAILAALLVPMATGSLSAQSWKWDWNINGGYSKYSDMLGESNTGVTAADVHFKSGGLGGTQLTIWPASKLGIRFNGTYADRPVTASDVFVNQFANSGLNHVNLWSLSGDLLLRFKSPAEEFTKMEMLPYIALGVGAKWHNPSGDSYTCNDTAEGKSWACAPFTVSNTVNTAGPVNYALAEANTLMGLAGLGADWRISRGMAIRTEIGDRIYDPRIHQLATAVPVGTTFNTADSDEDVSKTVHEIYGQVGLSFLFGVARPAAVAVIAPPPEPAPVTPTPTITRESISVCVVDPTATGGIRMQQATLVAGRDTVITVGGTDQPFSSSVGTVSTTSNADWFVRGQPLTVNVGKAKWEYVTYGSTRNINSSDLAFLGTVNGMPVYADRNEVKDVLNELNELNAAQNRKDFGDVLDEHKDLRGALDDIKVLYVPASSTGCVFQAVQRQEEVRKGGK
jgi:hypothetical protein